MGHHKTNTPASHYNKMIFTVNIAKEAPKNLVVKDKWKKIRSIWKKETRDFMEEIFSDSSKPDLPGSNLDLKLFKTEFFKNIIKAVL